VPAANASRNAWLVSINVMTMANSPNFGFSAADLLSRVSRLTRFLLLAFKTDQAETRTTSRHFVPKSKSVRFDAL